MIHLGIIGTNWITDQFVQAAHETGRYQLTAVYSRKLATAQSFAEKYGEVTCVDDLTAFFQLEELDTVYIASPNSLHFEQAKQGILSGKNVIVEKPAFSTPSEMAEIIELANENQVLFFEAARNIHEKSFDTIASVLTEHGNIIGANFTYMKYSSRYDAVLAGEEPNIFSPHFSGGALVDLGVYPVYAALAWFGRPQNVYYFARKIMTGVDGIGTIILRYETFDVTIQTGKIGNSDLKSEIYFENGTLELNAVNAIEQAVFYDRTNNETVLPVTAQANPMVEEAADFAEVIENKADPQLGARYEEWIELARDVNEAIYLMRKHAEISFDADKE
ncbi:Gfo/Idh/MocA family protein [Enterococcus gallinarum]|uniref:Gfo/Idh/MocA family oxidoreductase n=1 Tax=Enterococcus gallinarum TaxID=1353 RepID=A0A376H3X0_ENTGA|nr:Gfo/Idh/MocA family oxidoreductase [Enterococcus gallinarum]MDT2686645.1 Gfo/Idh/MocA family oxidoreductase [Enterococcus gallinarum]MDT2689518.1 Gfo/Idh/MocA family oxidoreductase [Enterococcus gallinarum]OJG48802.1 oxidoreductase [Enterococcus gallinarum]STD72502.1 oxidoreductase NAD-binding Rossmann fold protein [Enterococcus gallinarum]STD82869.1 oxidoreductase NAD-binding Rossmann fold protein [Enterococcus gallinarum]